MFKEDFFRYSTGKKGVGNNDDIRCSLFEYGWSVVDSLEFQKEYFDKGMAEHEASIEGYIPFSFSYLKCIWSG